jgi:predicted amidohydrolase YtcJ
MASHRYTRREFMGLSGAGITGLIGARWASGTAIAQVSSAQDPDLVVLNAKIYTVDPLVPRARAFAVRAGRFVAVGSTEDVRSLAGRRTQVFDAQQMTVVPGFIDAHNHAPGPILLYEVIVGNPYEVEFVTIASIVDKLRARARETPAGSWIEGFFFDDTKVQDKRALNIHDLDQVSRDHPVSVRHRGGHTTYYNSKAFELAGVSRNTPDSAAGTFDRDANGELNGRVTDRARLVFNNVGKRQIYTVDQTRQRNRDALGFISKQFVRFGLTSVHHEGGDLAALQQVRARGDLLHRVSYEAQDDVLEEMIKAGIATGFGDEWIKFGATSEHTCDGSFSERTMALSEPYPGVKPPYWGNIIFTQDDLNTWVERVHRAGIQVNCHANGDVTIDMVLTAYERAQRMFPRPDPRPKITHCTLINDGLLRRIKATGAVPAPFTSYGYYNTDKFRFYG